MTTDFTMPSRNIEEILTKAATAALDGTMTDTERVGMFHLAMTVTANELHRIEQSAPGTVSPESLMLLHQVALLCDPNVTKEKLFGKTLQVLEGESEDGTEEITG